MTKRMLVDATHDEEVRVAIVEDQRLLDLDIETSTKEQIKGNVYLGRVTRVEPSLQAAFVDFNGGRQGFLSINDIHPKYYPEDEVQNDAPPPGRSRAKAKATPDDQAVSSAQEAPLEAVTEASESTEEQPQESDADQAEQSVDTEVEASTDAEPNADEDSAEGAGGSDSEQDADESADESEEDDSDDDDSDEEDDESPVDDDDDAALDDEDGAEESDSPSRARPTRTRRRRNIPIQKILTKGQTVLVQVIKEARGTKGASLTTNISLAGRYTVLLPETVGGGGISRKIMDGAARKTLKKMLATMEISQEMSLIIRTAGLERTKREISRDMSYLTRLWKTIQDKCEKSKAPALIHEEGELIIRTIRDLYTTDMEEILIEGNDAYRRGKDFMRLLMPRYVKVVQPYKDKLPLFSRYQVENQIESMHDRVISLKSGGYIIIEPTEALVSIDVNSGRSTKEKNVENTAFKTNMQAVDEIARQLRLRDLGGLVVLDFIDMEERKHNLDVEKRLKEAFKNDRAKIQLGKISQFGLMELSRQRMKPAFAESNREVCPRCSGLGTIRSVESTAIRLFRCLEEEAYSGRHKRLVYTAPQAVANYLLNNKRAQLAEMESANELEIIIQGDAAMETPNFRREKGEGVAGEENNSRNSARSNKRDNRRKENPPAKESSAEASPVAEAKQPAADESATDEDGQKSGRKKRRRRRRRKSGGEGDSAEAATQSTAQSSTESSDSAEGGDNAPADVTAQTESQGDDTVATPEAAPTEEGDEAAKPKRKRRRRRSSSRRASGAEESAQGDQQPPMMDPAEAPQPDMPGMENMRVVADNVGNVAPSEPVDEPNGNVLPPEPREEDDVNGNVLVAEEPPTEKPKRAPRKRRTSTRSSGATRSRSRKSTASSDETKPSAPPSAKPDGSSGDE
ncbi:ribonuclease E/G [Magnetofaba australis]|uniref:Ribonuclease G n=1 Tax=Magnetofaba australis IT-1 TaxID=1434232 RepID=A0A1Y2K5W3_9PROT|nr:ribonuclease E/G [Magnetofaba australis]OSM05084.1 putative ribonuclease E [Magnetofaba australis IT-1]